MNRLQSEPIAACLVRRATLATNSREPWAVAKRSALDSLDYQVSRQNLILPQHRADEEYAYASRRPGWKIARNSLAAYCRFVANARMSWLK